MLSLAQENAPNAHLSHHMQVDVMLRWAMRFVEMKTARAAVIDLRVDRAVVLSIYSLQRSLVEND